MIEKVRVPAMVISLRSEVMVWSGAPLAGIMLHCKVEQACGGATWLHKTQVDETHAGGVLCSFVFATAQMQQNRAGRRG